MNRENSSNNPAVGIIVPIYNTAKYIERCLKSILNNTYSNIKVFCIDDGSKDESPEIVEKIAKNDNRVILIRQENSGVSAARNRGLESAFEENCEVIGFVDSDDWIHPQYIEILLKGLLCGCDISICEYMNVYEYIDNFELVNSPLIVNLDFKHMDQNKWVKSSLTGRLYKSTKINKTRFVYGIKNTEDGLFNLMVLGRNSDIKICYTFSKLYFYFQRQDSAVHILKGKNFIPAVEKSLEFLKSTDCTQYARLLYINEILKNILCARYLSKFDENSPKTSLIYKTLLKETWKIVNKDKIKFKGRFIFRLFSAFPSLYRLFRIATDRTMLDWEKAQKKKNR